MVYILLQRFRPIRDLEPKLPGADHDYGSMKTVNVEGFPKNP